MTSDVVILQEEFKEKYLDFYYAIRGKCPSQEVMEKACALYNEQLKCMGDTRYTLYLEGDQGDWISPGFSFEIKPI